MEKMLLKHIAGSKSGQTERFDLPLTHEVVFGRDASAQIIFDPNKDDLVSRLHARLSQDPADKTSFTLTDLNSRNGTHVNGMRITGPAKLNPGDVIELGTGGPKIEFDLDPRPASAPPATRLFSEPESNPATREAPILTRETPTMPIPPDAAPGAPGGMPPFGNEGTTGQTGTNTIGRATVERMISQTKSTNRKLVTVIAAAIVSLVIVLVGAIYWYQKHEARLAEQHRQEESQLAEQRHQEEIRLAEQRRLEDERRKAEELKNIQENLGETGSQVQKNTTLTMAGVDIADKYIPSTVFIETSWKLIDVATGRQLCTLEMTRRQFVRQFGLRSREIPNKYREQLPVYIISKKGIEPYLSVDEENGKPIGGILSGSGFVVSDNGFILTNRHVAAPWQSDYNALRLPGYVLYIDEMNNIYGKLVEELPSDYARTLKKWSPAKSSFLEGKPVTGKSVEGRLDYLDVSFPKSPTPWHATLEKISPSADVALIKVQIPHSVPSVTLCEENCLKVGEMVTVLGYPDVSPDAVVVNPSYVPLHREGTPRIIPEPTVTRGNVQKIIKGEAETLGGPAVKYFSSYGDVIQLAINTTGAGNSGGPVFNDRGQVVGIFTYRKWDGDNTGVSLAVPIKHGLDLMGTQRVIK